MSEFTNEDLAARTNNELRELCKKLRIPGMSKKRKDVMISAILLSQGGEKASEVGKSYDQAAPDKTNSEVTAATFTLNSVLTKPSAKFGDRTTTTIRVSSGAATGEFPVEGKPISNVKSFLKEVLNISIMSSPVVNGKQVDDNYVIKKGDEVEFLKPAGQKG